MTLRPAPAPDRSARILLSAVALLHFVLAGMLLYLRWGPIQRALEAFVRQGVEIPPWLAHGVTLGTVLMAVFLAFRGWLGLRRAWAGRSADLEPPGSR